ncbi:ornithine decarboxylase antizyme [Ophiocordyceps camponoti-floridani]|uniref:Ornithine decarboxylase antizyme n=1 Tax=Ophiocordyceps camponoti-floridani TaxID=2030778 RepID=A0A8H4Q9J9_9HYPO|nr:ornithine decarboxylase antizyme [Ophiocordyceps camponoti-floridani]
MAPMNYQTLNCSSRYGEDVIAPRVNVLASCYVVDSSANLKGLHYCTTGVAGAECPPLAALTSSNKLALLPKHKKRDIPGRRLERRGGAALVIREECERFFCESMKTVFRGERDLSMYGSGLSGAFMQTPPPEDHIAAALDKGCDVDGAAVEVNAWMEVWDYAGGASFRAFVVDDGVDKSLFVFFDVQGVLGRDLKRGLMALIELADGPLECGRIMTCIDRRIPAREALELTRSLQWVGFDMATLDHWAGDTDVTSPSWVLMGMEL